MIARWQKLLADSNNRKTRLLQVQDQFRKIEELFLLFAKKASAFNSWFENAEEDMTDPVRCNSVEEINSLRIAHNQFQVCLSGTIIFSSFNFILNLLFIHAHIYCSNSSTVVCDREFTPG